MKIFHVVVLGLGLLQGGAAQTCSDGTAGIDGNGVVCCTIGCGECGGSDCGANAAAAGLESGDCCGSAIKDAGVYCDDSGVAPCIIGSAPGATTCSDGTAGVDGNGVVCCTTGCTQCGGPDCGTAGAAAGLDASDCCGGAIKDSGVYCDDSGAAPCIIGSAPSSTTCSDGVTEGVDGNGVVCCPLGCSQCGGSGCAGFGEDCCGGPISESGVYCDDNGNVAPCILGSEPVETCSDGTPGVDGNGVVCCTPGCTQCGGSGCTDAGLTAADCCGTVIKNSGVFCDDSGVAPCIIGSAPTPSPTTAPVTTSTVAPTTASMSV